MKIIFLGTPDFSVPALERLIESKHEVVAVVCNHDKPSGRGNKLTPPPTKVVAEKFGIKVLQYKSVRKEGVADLKALGADIMITCAFGQILSQEIIDICPFGVLNIHGSLLPKYRGPAPIQWAIACGEETTGVTIMRTEAGLDTGPILISKSAPIDGRNSLEMFDVLSKMGSELILDALELVETNKAQFTKQKEEEMSYYPMIKKDTFKIDFNQTCKQIDAIVRGANPWPVAFFCYNDQPFKVYAVSAKKCEHSYKNGEVVSCSSKTGLFVACTDGLVEILSLVAPNSKRMTAKEYLNGKKIIEGEILN